MSLGNGPPVVFASNIFGQLNAYQVGWPAYREVTDRLIALGWRVILYDVRGISSPTAMSRISVWRRGSTTSRQSFLTCDSSVLHWAASTSVPRRQSPMRWTIKKSSPRWCSCRPGRLAHAIVRDSRLRAAYSAEPMADDDPQLFASIIGSVATRFEDPDLVRLLTDQFLQTTTVAGLAAYNAANGQIDLADLLPRVEFPTLVIHEAPFPFGSSSCAGKWRRGSRARNLSSLRRTRLRDACTMRTSPPSTAFCARPRQACTCRARARLAPHGQHSPDEARTTGVAAGGGRIDQQGDRQRTQRGAIHALEQHVADLYTKIGARGRADAIAYAIRHGLVPN